MLFVTGKPLSLPGDRKSLTFAGLGDDVSAVDVESGIVDEERQPSFRCAATTLKSVFVLAGSLGRLRFGLFEGPAIESPRLCRWSVTDQLEDRE